MEWLASQPPFVIYGGAFAFGVGLVFCLFRMASEREPPVAFAKPAEPPKVVEVKDMKAEELAKCNGVDGAPVYVCINGDIFDVEAKREMYSPPGEGYSIFAAKEAAIPLAMGLLKEEEIPADKTLNDLNGGELDSLRSWYGFFSGRYPIVGRLVDADGKPTKNESISL